MSIELDAAHHRLSKGDLAIHVDVGEITHQLTQDLQGLESKVAIAVKRAIKKVGTWLRTHSVREIGKALKIKQSIIRNRYHFKQRGKGNTEKLDIWVGLLAVAAHHAGKGVQGRTGTRIAGRQYKSAFIAKIYGSEERVFIRSAANKREGHFTLGDKAQKEKRRLRDARSARHLPAGLKGRFPVEVIGIDISEVGLEVLERYEKRLNKRYGEILQQELNYALNIEN